MPAKRKPGPDGNVVIPPNPNYESNSFNERNHLVLIDTAQPQEPGNLQAHLEAERDHYLATAMIAGRDPITKREVLFPGADLVEALIDRGIAAAVLIAQSSPHPVSVSIRAHLREASIRNEDYSGNRVVVSVSEEPIERMSRRIGSAMPDNPTTPGGA